MLSKIYTQNLEEIPKRLKEQEDEVRNNKQFRILQEESRRLLEEIYGIPQDKILIIYGEQADPPIIKNIGKAFLSAIIEKQLKKQGINAEAVYLPLFNDIFGSNAEVFKSDGLLTKKQISRLGRQTYAFAPTPPEYVNRFFEIIQQDHPDRQAQLEELGIKESYMRENTVYPLGKFNISLRELLEHSLIGYKHKNLSLSPLESCAIKNEGLLSCLLQFSNVTETKAPIYLTTKIYQEKLPTETGYRRCPVSLTQDRNSSKCIAQVTNPETNEILSATQLEELIKINSKDTKHPPHRFSLNAGTRAALLYASSIPGIYITGGGSTYNDNMCNIWTMHEFPKPILAYISNQQFIERGSRLALDIPGKYRDIREILAESEKVKTTDDFIFAHFAAWRAP